MSFAMREGAPLASSRLRAKGPHQPDCLMATARVRRQCLPESVVFSVSDGLEPHRGTP